MPWSNVLPFSRNKSGKAVESQPPPSQPLPKEECSVCTFQNAPTAEVCQWKGISGNICGNPLTPVVITTKLVIDKHGKVQKDSPKKKGKEKKEKRKTNSWRQTGEGSRGVQEIEGPQELQSRWSMDS